MVWGGLKYKMLNWQYGIFLHFVTDFLFLVNGSIRTFVMCVSSIHKHPSNDGVLVYTRVSFLNFLSLEETKQFKLGDVHDVVGSDNLKGRKFKYICSVEIQDSFAIF